MGFKQDMLSWDNWENSKQMRIILAVVTTLSAGVGTVPAAALTDNIIAGSVGAGVFTAVAIGVVVLILYYCQRRSGAVGESAKTDG